MNELIKYYLQIKIAGTVSESNLICLLYGNRRENVMGWSIGFDSNWNRDIGYGVPAICDHPGCDEKIDRGLAYVCGGDAYGGELGCGLFFCEKHQHYSDRGAMLCERCDKGKEPFEAKPDVDKWIKHKLTDESWAEWRKENPDFVKENASRFSV